MRNRKAPGHLSGDSRRVWHMVVEGWSLLDSDYPVLEVALTERDRLIQAREILKKDGLILIDDKKRKYLHPAVLIQKQSTINFLRAWKQLGLDAEPPLAVGRPPGR